MKACPPKLCRWPRRALVLIGATLLFAAGLRADPPVLSSDELAKTYAAASSAFTAGDYAAAAAGLEKVVTQAPPDAQLESVYYTLGAAYFNLGQHAKAIAALQTYRTKYPGGTRVAEATFSLGQAALLSHDYARAAEAFKSLEGVASYRAQALLLEGTALKEAGEIDGAIAVLEKLVGPKIRDSASANAALMLAGLYGQKKQADKTVAVVAQIRRQFALLENPAQFNTLAMDTGDTLLSQKLAKEALACYRAIPSREQVIKLQGERIGALRDELTRQVAMIRADPKGAAVYLAEQNRLKSAIADTARYLAEFQKLPGYEPAVLIRIAACFTQMSRKWETIVVYEELLRRFPSDPLRESALYGLITASSEVGRYVRAHDYCEEYLKAFPGGPHAGEAGYLMGAMALQMNDPKAAVGYFGQVLASQAQSPYRETMQFLLGNAHFVQGEYDQAEAAYTQCLKDFPKGQNAEEATYRTALCAIFAGKYEKALALLNDYLKAYPQGNFVPDARYRVGVCQLAASQYDAVIAACMDWEKQYGHAPLLGEVLSLQGDAFEAKGDHEAAVAAYLRAYQAAAALEVADYAVFAAQKLLLKAGDWPRIATIFEQYLRDHPDAPSAVMAVYWIGKARAHEGKADEAKQFVAETIKKNIADPTREGVEQLLTQLATLCAHKKAAAPGADPAKGELNKPATPGAEMEALLGGAETNGSCVARARVIYGKSELARLLKQAPSQDKELESLATGFQPQDLSAPLLAVAGDHLLEKKCYDQAKPFFQRLLSFYPKSAVLDSAYNGLGEIAYQSKDYPAALSYFTDAVDKAGAAAKLKEVTVGKAKTLLAMGRFDEAKPLFEQIASAREWRGESTAFAVYSLGEIMRRQNKLPEAIAYYQRVFVAYQRFLPWVAKSYVASAECFEQLGKNQEAVNTFREMLKNPKLQDSSEAQTARNYLQKNSQG